MTPHEVLAKEFSAVGFNGEAVATSVMRGLTKAGFVIVPKEPTEAMCEAMREELRCVDTNQGGESGPVPGLEDGAERAAYAAMLRATKRSASTT
jgi:hypothetical protein